MGRAGVSGPEEHRGRPQTSILHDPIRRSHSKLSMKSTASALHHPGRRRSRTRRGVLSRWSRSAHQGHHRNGVQERRRGLFTHFSRACDWRSGQDAVWPPTAASRFRHPAPRSSRSRTMSIRGWQWMRCCFDCRAGWRHHREAGSAHVLRRIRRLLSGPGRPPVGGGLQSGVRVAGVVRGESAREPSANPWLDARPFGAKPRRMAPCGLL